MKKLLIIGLIGILILGLTACGTNDKEGISIQGQSNEKKGIQYELTEEGIIKEEYAEKIIKDIADEAIAAIKNKDGERLSQLSHPTKGVRFTPYTYVSVEKDVVFDQKQMKTFFSDANEYVWGVYDGSGEEIRLTPSQYYEEFIYSADFMNAEQISYNRTLSQGNMIINHYEVYDKPIVVEYYYSGFNPEYEGLDWKSLRLVFEEYNSNWYLVGIIHNSWTV